MSWGRRISRQAGLTPIPTDVVLFDDAGSASVFNHYPARRGGGMKGVGVTVTSCIAAPMVGGVFAVWLSTLIVLPALYYLWHSRSLSPAPEDRAGNA